MRRLLKLTLALFVLVVWAGTASAENQCFWFVYRAPTSGGCGTQPSCFVRDGEMYVYRCVEVVNVGPIPGSTLPGTPIPGGEDFNLTRPVGTNPGGTQGAGTSTNDTPVPGEEPKQDPCADVSAGTPGAPLTPMVGMAVPYGTSQKALEAMQRSMDSWMRLPAEPPAPPVDPLGPHYSLKGYQIAEWLNGSDGVAVGADDDWFRKNDPEMWSVIRKQRGCK